MKQKTKTFFIISGTLIIGILLGISISSTFHQERMDKIKRMSFQQRFGELIQRIIKPTEAQQKILNQIIEKRSTQIDLLREQQHLDLMAVLDSLRTELNSALTDEQRQLLEQEIQKGEHRPFTWRMNQLERDLELTDEQRKKIEQIFLKTTPQFPFGRKPDFPDTMRHGERKDRFQNRKQMMRKIEQEIEQVLTPDQLKKFKKLKKSLPFGPEKSFGRRGKRPGPPFFRHEEN